MALADHDSQALQIIDFLKEKYKEHNAPVSLTNKELKEEIFHRSVYDGDLALLRFHMLFCGENIIPVVDPSTMHRMQERRSLLYVFITDDEFDSYEITGKNFRILDNETVEYIKECAAESGLEFDKREFWKLLMMTEFILIRTPKDGETTIRPAVLESVFSTDSIDTAIDFLVDIGIIEYEKNKIFRRGEYFESDNKSLFEEEEEPEEDDEQEEEPERAPALSKERGNDPELSESIPSFDSFIDDVKTFINKYNEVKDELKRTHDKNKQDFIAFDTLNKDYVRISAENEELKKQVDDISPKFIKSVKDGIRKVMDGFSSKMIDSVVEFSNSPYSEDAKNSFKNRTLMLVADTVKTMENMVISRANGKNGESA